MASSWRTWSLPRLGLVVAVMLTASVVSAADRSQGRTAAASQPSGQQVELFAAIEKGQVEVQLIPKDATLFNVRIKNNTDQPLSVKLPEAFAGVPILAQRGGAGGMGAMGGGGGRRGGGGGGYGGGGMGGMGGMGGGMGGMGGGMGGMGGFFNVAPDKVGIFKVPVVCLEHGKPDPRPGMKYEIKPIDQATGKPEVHEVCKALGKGEVAPRVAQVAAWHMNNGMTWEQLAAKQIHRAPGMSEPYFAPAEIQAAMKLASAVASAIEKQKQKQNKDRATSPSSQSLSQN